MIRALREPLVQFLLYGAVLFAVHALYGAAAGGGDGRIAVSAERVLALRQELALQLKRMPSEEELHAAVGRWIDDELLVRQAQSLGLDRADPIVRRRLVLKMESLVAMPAEAEAPTDTALQALLDADPQRYGTPERFTFEHVAFSRGSRQDRLVDDAQSALRRLREDASSAAPLGDPFFAGRRLADQDGRALRSVFGREFAERLARLPVGDWQGPVESGYGLHLVRVEQRKPFEPATLDAARKRLQIDWTERRKQALLREHLAGLRGDYEIVVEAAGGAPQGQQTARVDEHE